MKIAACILSLVNALPNVEKLGLVNPGQIDIDSELIMSGIEPGHLLMRRLPSTMFNSTGPALREKIYTMQSLYQKYKSTGLEEAETNSLLQIRKLLQLKTLVTTLLDDSSIDFDRFCFYGCYCLPDAAIHDSSPGAGQPVDQIDNSCKELKQCYQCANRDTQEDKGDECHQDAAYSVNPLTDNFGKIYDYQCTNRENSCRWRICQCDRAFAHKIKAEHDEWNVQNHKVLGGFDRGQCQSDLPTRGAGKQCCGNYESPKAAQQRQMINPNLKQCCNNQSILPFGEFC